MVINEVRFIITKFVNNDEQEEMFLKSIVAAVREEEVEEEGEEEKMKEERKVSFAQAVTGPEVSTFNYIIS